MRGRFVATTAPLLALACTLATASGCSLLYDPDKLGGGQGSAVDGGHVGPDATAGALHLQQVTPQLVHEGQGDALDPADLERVRAVPIVLLGSNFSEDMTVSISGDEAGDAATEVELSVSSDGHWAAFELRVPVDESRGAGVDVPLTITLRQESAGGEAEEREGVLVRRMLDELDRPTGGSIQTDERSGVSLYSRVDLRGDVIARGIRPVRVVGHAGIRLDGRLGAEGSGQRAGVGGCDGGNAVEDASCGAGSGRGGDDGLVELEPGGGGGGAFGAADAKVGGGGVQGGGAGDPTAAPSLVPLPPASQSPAGGGGGGRTLTLAGGGPGGGSGGILELTSPGVIRIDGIVSVDGASPGPCEGGGGGGGGGSGGAILLRAGAGLLSEHGALLQARGGRGGEVQCATRGGDGGVGVIRVDQPEVSQVETEPAAVPGPALILPGETIVNREELTLTVRGKAGSSYNVRVTGFDRATNARAESNRLVATPKGIGQARVSLWEGHNEICVQADANTSYPESQNCLSVAYIH